MTMIETEIKFKIDSLHEVKRKIKGRGGIYESSFFEDNIVFDDENGTLFKKTYLLRLRKCDRITLTAKKPIEKDQYKVMEEHEVEVSDFEKTIGILNLLGYHKVFRYQKMRETFAFNETKVNLDDTPIGNYIEIEGEKKDIEQSVKLLGLDMNRGISKNYLELYREYCKETGKEPSDMVFLNPPEK
jgi:adenylate cyclase class 2